MEIKYESPVNDIANSCLAIISTPVLKIVDTRPGGYLKVRNKKDNKLEAKLQASIDDAAYYDELSKEF